jgi:catechol 2,3-dioxygenase-like lactoylglutathione lyase family enzyme
MSGYQLSLLKIPVSDISRAAGFYRDAMGLAEEFVVPEYGWGQFSAGDLSIAIYVPGKGGGNGPVGGTVDFHLSLPTEEFVALSRRIGADMVEAPDGLTFLEAVDPDGNSLKVVRR